MQESFFRIGMSIFRIVAALSVRRPRLVVGGIARFLTEPLRAAVGRRVQRTAPKDPLFDIVLFSVDLC